MENEEQNHTPDWLKKINPQIGEQILSIVSENSIEEKQLKSLLEIKLKQSFFTKKEVKLW